VTAARVVSCGASGLDEKVADWVPLDPGDEPSRGASLAMLGGAGGVAVLLVELAAGGVVAEHTTPDVSVCHVVEGGGTVFFPGGDEIAFERGDTIEFAGDVPHGWRGGSERTLLAVTTYPEDSGKAAA
jgi:quercetin dioxygenase-like cupin family protein